MHSLLQAADGVSALAATSMIAALWQGILLAACVALFLKLFPGISAAARHLVWLALFALIVLLHFAPSLLQQTHATSAIPHGPLHIDVRWSIALAALWIVMSVVRAAQLLRSAANLRSISRRLTLVEPGEDCAALLHCNGRRIELCVSPDVDRPCVAGLLHPRILLPPDLLARLSRSELEQIVLHEMEHLRRRDDWTNLLQKIALVLFPLNPALLWVERRLCAEREMACDDGVLRSTGARKAYAICLANLAEHSLLRRGISLALGAWERPSELTRRVVRILCRPQSFMGPRKMATAVSTLVLAVAGGSVLLARSPQLVSFVPPVSGSITAARSMPVNTQLLYPSSRSAAHATLVKAVMLPHQVVKLGQAPHRRIAHPHRGAEPRLLSTNWNQSSPAPRLTFAVATYEQFSYAAVPVRGGWLIIRL